MKYNHQTIKHDPANGQYGDCMRTCVACMLDLEVVDVPNFAEASNPWVALDTWLRINRPERIMFIPVGERKTLFDFMRDCNHDIIYMLLGNDHAVVCQGDQIIHDPSWLKTSVTSPTHALFFIDKRFTKL